jgi:putative hydrolase of the HAD superfamily
MAIKAVFFDMGGTIQTFTYDRELRLKATPGVQRILAKAGINLHLTNEQLFTIISSGLADYHAWRLKSLEELPAYQVWRNFIFKKKAVDEPKLKSVAEKLMLYLEMRYYSRELRPEIPQVLEQVRKMGLKIGLISNVVSLGQVPINLRQYKIKQYFHPIVLSSEYGRRKPDPAIFHYAARLARVPTGECVYVGDRIARDVQGAKRAGFRLAIQIMHDFQHGEKDSGAKPDAIIHSMGELVGILKKELRKDLVASSGRRQKGGWIKAFLFDAGDILYYRPNKGEKLKTFLNKLGLKMDDRHPEKRRALQYAAYRGEISRDEYLEAVLKLYGVKEPAAIRRGKQIIGDDDNHVRFFKGVPQTLRRLKKKGYYLGIITDTSIPVSIKMAWFEKAGFGNVWDSVVSSREVGARKPNPQIYKIALDQLGLRPDEAIFVGHMKSELDGARALGIHTVGFNMDADASAQFLLARFSDLLRLPLLDAREKEAEKE